MKRLLLLAIPALLLFGPASLLHAWQVDFLNNCDWTVDARVYGERLFGDSLDCELKVAPGQTVTCYMPSVVCPKLMGGSYNPGNGTVKMNNKMCSPTPFACCWNLYVKFIKGQGSESSCSVQVQ